MTTTKKTWAAALLSVATVVAALLVPASASAETPQPATIPLTLTNSSGREGALHLSILGHFIDDENNAGEEGFLGADGNFTPFPTATGEVPAETLDTAFDGPRAGEEKIISVPFGFSGRLYYSFDKKLRFQTVIDADGRTNVVQPVPWLPESASSQVDVDFDWSELSYTAWGLYLNSSQVDQFGAPAAVGAVDADGTVSRRGVTMRPVAEVGAEIASVPGFERSVQTDGGVLRVLNPSKLLDESALRMPADYLDAYISAAWDAYRDQTLVVQPFAFQPETRFYGRVVGDRFEFRNAKGDLVTAFDKPSTKDVFSCDGALTAPNDMVVGPIARSLCADLNRGVLGSQAVSPAMDPATFYQPTALNGGRFNHYSRIIHENMADGRAYAFAFDDVAAQESLVHAPRPVSASIEILPEHA